MRTFLIIKNLLKKFFFYNFLLILKKIWKEFSRAFNEIFIAEFNGPEIKIVFCLNLLW